MKPTTTKLFTRLTHHKIGVAEASTLWLSAEGKTTPEIADIQGVPVATVRGRVQALMAKKILTGSKFAESGHKTYKPTRKGQTIIEDVDHE